MENQLEKSDMTMFKKLGNFFSFFKKDVMSLEELQKLEQKQAIQEKVSTILNNNLEKMLDVLISYLESGYDLTPGQTNTLHAKMSNLPPDRIYKLFDKLTPSQLKANDDLYTEIIPFIDKEGYGRSYYLRHLYYTSENKTIEKILEEKLKNKEFRKKLFKDWKYFVNVGINIERESYSNTSDEAKVYAQTHIGLIHKYQKEMLSGQNMEELLDLTDWLKKTAKECKKKDGCSHIYEELYEISSMMPEYAKKICEEEIQQTKNQIEILYAENYLQQKIEEEAQKMTVVLHTISKEVPYTTQEIIKAIQHEFSLLNKNITSLNENDAFKTKNAYNNRVPQILNKYLMLDEDYKEMVNRDGKTPLQLMEDSLFEILDTFKEIRAIRNESVIGDLSALNQYTKKM